MSSKDHASQAPKASDGAPHPRPPQTKRIFGESYKKGSTTIIPVAAIRGRARPRRRSGSTEQNHDSEIGQDFGSTIRPIGVYVVTDDKVVWRPSLDLNQVIRGGQAIGALTIVAATYLLGRKFFRRPQ